MRGHGRNGCGMVRVGDDEMGRASRAVPEELHELVFAEACRQFGPRNRYGVHGVAIDWPRREGRWGARRAVVAYVRRKLAAPRHPVNAARSCPYPETAGRESADKVSQPAALTTLPNHRKRR